MLNINVKKHFFDVTIIGAGGSGLAAAIFAAKRGLKVALVSKVHPLQSHTVAAQGGINASLGNITEDDWRWHAYDTIKASDWLADQDSVEEMCSQAPEVIAMLSELGVEFDQNRAGKIDQKIYGGQSTLFGKGTFAYRACFVKDRTGHSIIHKLYDEAIRCGVVFFNYNFAIDLLFKDECCHGVISLDIEQGILNTILASNTIIATGGGSQVYLTSTSSSICTGDGGGLVARVGVPLQDMEFVQFHPTAIPLFGVLITEAARSAGGKLVNSLGEQFMKRYAPKFNDLAARDVVARAIATEIKMGRGCGDKKDYIHLDLRHLSEGQIKEKLPTVFENCEKFLKINPSKELIPVVPAAHYMMGGIPTDSNCQVVKFDGNDRTIEGLYAIGEAACISVHGAGRLGCNSLLDLIVFAKKVAGLMINKKHEFDADEILQSVSVKINKILSNNQQVYADIREKLKRLMSHNVGVFRNQNDLGLAYHEVLMLEKEYYSSGVSDISLNWNIDLIGYFELENMLILAKAIIRSAIWRKESRGAHWRVEFQESNLKFLVHSICYPFDDNHENIYLRKVRLAKNNVDFYQPVKRNY